MTLKIFSLFYVTITKDQKSEGVCLQQLSTLLFEEMLHSRVLVFCYPPCSILCYSTGDEIFLNDQHIILHSVCLRSRSASYLVFIYYKIKLENLPEQCCACLYHMTFCLNISFSFDVFLLLKIFILLTLLMNALLSCLDTICRIHLQRMRSSSLNNLLDYLHLYASHSTEFD